MQIADVLATPPAWLISALCIGFMLFLFLRARQERNVLLFGKIGTLIIIAVIYAMFDIDMFDIITARTLSRYSWILYLLAEISYHIARYKPGIFKRWIGTAS